MVNWGCNNNGGQLGMHPLQRIRLGGAGLVHGHVIGDQATVFEVVHYDLRHVRINVAQFDATRIEHLV